MEKSNKKALRRFHPLQLRSGVFYNAKRLDTILEIIERDKTLDLEEKTSLENEVVNFIKLLYNMGKKELIFDIISIKEKVSQIISERMGGDGIEFICEIYTKNAELMKMYFLYENISNVEDIVEASGIAISEGDLERLTSGFVSVYECVDIDPIIIELLDVLGGSRIDYIVDRVRHYGNLRQQNYIYNIEGGI